MLFYLFVLAWAVTSVVGYGICFAYWQRKYPLIADEHYYADMLMSAFMALAGPINLIAIAMAGVYGYGFKFK